MTEPSGNAGVIEDKLKQTGQYTAKKRETKSSNFVRLERRRLETRRSVFVRPTGFPETISDSRQRIYIVSGEVGSGKMTTAVNLAMLIAETTSDNHSYLSLPIYSHQRSGRAPQTLNEIITDPAFSRDSIYIIKNALEIGLKPESLSGDFTDNYQRELQRQGAYIILTTATESVFSSEAGYRIITTSGIDVADVFDTHLNYHYIQYFPEDPTARLLQEHKNEILQVIQTPKAMGIFFERLYDENPTDKQELSELIRRLAGRETSALRRRFRDLDFNPKLFAMLIALLSDYFDVQLYDAEELYNGFVQKLRQDPGMDGERIFIDPRRIGIDDLVAQAGLNLDIDQRINFNDDYTRRNILANEVPNYHGLLWIVQDLLHDAIWDIQSGDAEGPYAKEEAPPPEDERPQAALLSDDYATRLAFLAGQVGFFREKKLMALLDELAHHPDGEIAYLVARILTPISQNPEQHDFILNMLSKWLLPEKTDGEPDHDPDLLWASIQVIAEIYPRVRRLASPALDPDAYPGMGPDDLELARAAERTLNQLRDHLSRIGQTCGIYKTYADAYENALTDWLSSPPADLEEDEDTGVLELTEGELATLHELIQELVAERVLRVAEQNTRALIGSLDWLIQFCPDDVVDCIISWLQRGVEAPDQDDYDLDDKEIEQMLIMEEAGPFTAPPEESPEEEKRRRARRRSFDDMAWRMGVAATVYLFAVSGQQKEQRPRPRPSTSDESAATTEQSEKPEQPDTPPAPEEKEPPEDKPTEPETPAGQKPGGKPPQRANTQAIAGNVSQDERTRNQIDIQLSYLPLLRLLPPILRTIHLDPNVYNFLSNLTRSQDIIKLLINDEIEFELAELFDADPIDVAMDAIRRWYDLMGRDEFARQKWVEAVYPVMLELINCATLDLRARLRAALSEQGWLDAPHADVRYIAQAMVSRSYMLDGVVIDVPAERYGAILLDASSRSRHDPYYYQTAFILAQRLSAVTPVRLYHMGAQRQIAEVGLEREEPDNLLTPKKLRSTRQRDRLIMPFFEPLPDDLAVLDSERCHYVLVLTPTDAIYPDIEERIDEDVIDLLDILELATSNISAGSQQILDDPFATDAEKEAARQAIAAVDWPWSGKLFLISTDRRAVVRDLTHALRTLVQDGQVRNLQNKPESILDVIDVSSGFLFNADLDKIEMRLNQRIAKNLYTLSAADWQRDLAVMWSRQNAPPDAPVREMLDQWVNQLGLVDHARHPDDVSRAIAWTVLAVARTDLRLAVEIVSGWLGSDNDLTANMGLACAKLLFNFYDLADDLVSDHERYVCLLDLIEPFVKLERGPAEFRQVLRVIMRWARYSVWADQFVASVDRDSPLLNGIHAITDRKNIPHLRWLVGVHETLLAIADWLIRSRLDWERFEYLIEQVWEWHTDTPGYLRTDSIGDFTNRLGHRNVTPDMIAEIDDMIEMLGEWRFSMPYLLDLFERNIMAIVEQPHDTIREWRRNVKRVADSMRLELYNRTDLPMPKLADGKRYGVIMVDVSPGSQEMLHTITGFVRNFQRRAQEENLDILITIHRVGRTELVYSSRNSPPRRRELRPEGTPHFAPIIGPTLERYDPADVAFVLVATTDRILDWDDWVDDDRWMARLHIHTSRMRRWMRFQTENQTKQHVKENILQLTDDIVDQLKQGVF